MPFGFDDEPDHEIEISVFRRLADSPRRPDAGGLYQSSRWLAMLERGFDVRYIAAVARDDPAGEAAGLLPIYLLDPPRPDDPYNAARAFGRSMPAESPAAVVAGRWGYRSGWSLVTGVRRGGSGSGTPTTGPGFEPRVLAAMLRAAARVAADLGACSLSALYLPADEVHLACLTEVLDARDFALHSTEAVISLPGRAFEDYLGTLSHGGRARVRREMRRFSRLGLTIRICRLSEAMEFAPRLLGAIQARHGRESEEAELRAVLQANVDAFDDVSTTFVAEDPEHRPVAYTVAYSHGETLYMRLGGLDHVRSEPSGAYFMTSYYAPIRHAYEHGLRRVDVGGTGSLRPKVLRGARLAPLYGFIRDRNGDSRQRDWTCVGRANQAHLRAQLGDLGRLADGLPPVFGDGTPGRAEVKARHDD